MGRVYLGEHLALKNKLAIKVLQPELSSNEEVVRRFEREAVAAGTLEHANVARATDFGRTTDGRLYLVLEYVPGMSLQQVLAKEKPLSAARACRIARQMLLGLAHAHGRGVVHRDLKPENVVLVERPDGEADFVKILDFGIAKLTAPELHDGAPPTQLGLVYGTPEYLSPEQAMGKAVDHRADLYAVGVVFYEMIVGRRPFVATEQALLLLAHAREPPPRPSSLGPVHPALEAFVLRLLEKSPDARYADAREALAALDEAEATLPTVPAKPSVDVRAPTVAMATQTAAGQAPFERQKAALRTAWTWGRAHPDRAAAVVAGFLCVVIVSILVAFSAGDDETAAPVAGVPSSATSPGSPGAALPAGVVPPRTRSTVELQALVDAQPEDAGLRRELAAAWARVGDLAQSVRHAGDALRLDPDLRADPVLQDNLVDALSSQRVWQDAYALLRGSVGEAGLPTLHRGAVEDPRMRVRQRSRELIAALGAAPPEWVGAAFALDDARSCEERSAAVARIRQVSDPRLLWPLRRRQRDKRRADRDCDPAELGGAIAMLGG